MHGKARIFSSDVFTMDTNGGRHGTQHVLVIPMIQQAHFVSAIRLAKKLSARVVQITIVTVNKHVQALNKIYGPKVLQNLGINIESVDDFHCIPSPMAQSKCMERVFEPLRQRLIATKKAGLLCPTCMVADR
ncbi:hypothetical protein Mapa_012506 [Marchantia paleacea]|nr:hypothetical protein Mapa_012506 [Marchantia paleacea]